jgi:hypothetical protein
LRPITMYQDYLNCPWPLSVRLQGIPRISPKFYFSFLPSRSPGIWCTHPPLLPSPPVRPSVPVWLWQSPKANPRSSRRDGRKRPEIYKKKFLAGTQQAGRSFARAVERPSRTFTLHVGVGWPLNRAPAADWAILSVRSQGKLLPSFNI